MLELLKTYFGYDSFLPLQEEIIASVMDGRDCFALMPTGGGKSLCYQLPAMALSGVTLVVSPLIALMKDQVDAMQANGLPAAFINSTQTPDEQRQIVKRIRSGEIKLVYVAPERVIEPWFVGLLPTLNVSLIAIDEAHCVSEWGHEFRPAYRGLASLRLACPSASVIALTATATERVRADILAQLGLRAPQSFISSFNRPNLTYSVVPRERDLSSLFSLLESHRDESVIIYCGSRKTTEEMADSLKAQGFAAEAYHAGLGLEVRRATQERFILDRTPIIVATIAFGMGINKPDVRLVVHHDLPRSVEGYYQETGRAGRDGQPAECVLYFSYAGKAQQEYFIRQMENPEERERARWRLNQVISLCSLSACRRKFFLEYLGEEWPQDNCGGCDNCVLPREQYNATEIAQKILSAVVRTGERFGAAHVISVLRGSRGERIRQQNHDQLSVYGIAADYPHGELRDLVEELKRIEFLVAGDGEYPTLRLTPRGREFLKNRETLTLLHPIHRRAEPLSGSRRVGQAANRDGGAGNYDAGLYDELTELRKAIATERGLPAFMIFSNRSLQDMARKPPRTPAEFALVSGVGRAKLEDLGPIFLSCINTYISKHGILETGHAAKSPVSIEPASRAISRSVQETGCIISSGASLEEATAKRGLSAQTIVGHIEGLVESGISVEWAHLLPPPERRAAIEVAFETVGDNPLRPVWEELNGGYSYNEIRLARLAWRKGKQSGSPQRQPFPPPGCSAPRCSGFHQKGSPLYSTTGGFP